MKIVLTVNGGAAEYLDAQLAFHLHAGVDLVLAEVRDGDDDASEVLDRYARQGLLARVQIPPGDPADRLRSLARLAAVEHQGDWLIPSVAGEFWWPRGASLRDVLVAVPSRYGVVQALTRRFRWSAGADFFAERMVVRESLASATAGPEPLLHLLRAIRRLDRSLGAHPGQPLRAWYPVEVLSFPSASAHEEATGDAVDLADGLRSGSLVVDERLRDVLRSLRDESGFHAPIDGERGLGFSIPSVVEDAMYAVECAAVGEVDLDRLDREIRDLEGRIAQLEARFWPRLLRWASRRSRRTG